MATASRTADPPTYKGLTDEVVTILVGPEEEPFHVSKELLSSNSPFFKAAFEGSFKEAAEKTIRLPEDDPNVFPDYLLWLYTGNLRSSEADTAIQLDGHCHLYVLAEKYGSEVLQNLVIDKILGHAPSPGELPDEKKDGDDNKEGEPFVEPTTLHYVYGCTLPDSVLRTILVDILAWQVDFDSSPELVNAPQECLFDVVKTCARRLPYEIPDEAKYACANYHIHKSSKRCPSPKNSDSVQSI
ncbi:MAG: hypothetical protein Q9172_005640 [Xanthocarpia lactea]